MKCSLLTLSTFIDDALPAERAAEVDAHVVGCPRCSAGVSTLREERDRVAGLARVSVEWESAQALLEQVGIGATTATAPPRREAPPAAVAPSRPWLSAGGGGAALPWAPQRPPVPASPPSAITEEANVQTVDPDVQPDLPFDAASDDSSAIASQEVEAVGHPQPGAAATGWGADLDDEPPAPLEDWEAAVPAYEDDAVGTSAPVTPVTPEPSWEPEPEPSPSWADAAPAAEWQESGAEPVAPPEHVAPPVGAMDYDLPGVATGAPVGPPQRLEPVGGPRALFERARDLVSVRLALARSRPADDIETVMPPPAPREALTPVRPAAPIRGFEQPDVAAALPFAPAVAVETMPEAPPPPVAELDDDPTAPPPIELNGAPAPMTPAQARADAIRALRAEAEARGGGGVPDDWNAFGAAAYQHAHESEPEAKPAKAKMGRHLRQARKQPVPFSARVAPLIAALTAILAAVGAAVASAGRAATGAVRSVAGGRSTPTAAATTDVAPATRSGARVPTVSPRVIAAGGLAVVVFLLALFVGRGGTASPTTSGTAARGTTAPTAAAQSVAPGTTQPAPATSAPAATTNAPLSGVKTFGSGATGLSLDRVRYGVFNGSQRLVFDLSGAASGSPSTSIGFSTPTTLAITFTGTAPPASWLEPPSGGVVAEINTTSTHGGTTTVTLTLTRASTPVAFYLSGPERFVIDLH